jgi:pantoate--beta-alanine ligase
MEQVGTAAALRERLRLARQARASVGFVPTMGAFHEGHLTLMRRARAENDRVVVSLFVNPTQFGPNEDFTQYPRNLQRDAALAAQTGIDWLFHPEVAEIYPPGDDTTVQVHQLTRPLEGRFRPGHFRGVTTVVSRLFNLVLPDRAYFGRKDYQQLRVIERMTEDLRLPIAIVPVETVREPEGLAMSSRNQYLSAAERKAALALIGSLRAAEAAYAAGERRARVLHTRVCEVLAAEPSVCVQYAAVVDADTLTPLRVLDRPALVALAAFVGRTRLIDNTVLGESVGVKKP